MANPFRVLFINPPRVHENLHTLRDEICFQDVTYVPFPLRLAVAAAQARELPGVEAAAIDANAQDMTWEELRSIRNQALVDSDWRALKDVTLPNPWKEYRQALRDLPQDYDSANDAADNWPEASE